MNILLIEPDRVLAETYAAVLRTENHDVLMAQTAQGGIHAADSRRPALVILELQLVSHSGIEFLYEFRSYDDWQDIPVMILTSVPAAEFADNQALLDRLGVASYHYKPRTSLNGLLAGVQTFAVTLS